MMNAALLRVPEPKAFLSVARACRALAEAREFIASLGAIVNRVEDKTLTRLS